MILTLSWLRNHLNTKANINEIIAKLTNLAWRWKELKRALATCPSLKLQKF